MPNGIEIQREKHRPDKYQYRRKTQGSQQRKIRLCHELLPFYERKTREVEKVEVKTKLRGGGTERVGRGEEKSEGKVKRQGDKGGEKEA